MKQPVTKQDGKKYEIDMCNGPILKKMLRFALPLMCSSILQLLFNAADIIVVGRFAGDDSLAAVGSNTSLIGLLTNLFIGLSIGANVLTARYYGAKKQRELRRTVHTAMLLSMISGLLLTVIGIIGARSILRLMNTPESVLDLATLYLRIYFLGMIAMMVYNFGSAILRAIGDTRRPLYYLAIAGLINVVLNLFFVIQLKMDVAGVATATVISQCVSAFLILRCLQRGEGAIKLHLSKIHIYKDNLKKIMEIGLPAGFQGILFSLSNVAIQASINSFGEIVMAGNSAAANIENFVYFAMNAFYQAAISFTSQNMGAGKYERIHKIMFRSQACAVVAGLVLGNLAFLFGHTLLGIYTTSEAVIQAGMCRPLHRILYVCALWHYGYYGRLAAGIGIFPDADAGVSHRGMCAATGLDWNDISNGTVSYGGNDILVLSGNLDSHGVSPYSLLYMGDEKTETEGGGDQR